VIPLLIIRAYRLIPPRVRGAVFRGRSTSHLALAAIAGGMNGWAALWRYGRPRLGDGGFFGDWGT
jgi:hypothetical protein